MMDVLLINPPFAMPDKPCISLPTLAGYLKQAGVHVRGLDVNIEFFHYFLSPANLRASQAFAEQRMTALQAQPELTASENTEYAALREVIQQARPAWNQLELLFEPYPFSNVEKFALLRLAVAVASLPHYPEGLGFTDTTGYIRYRSPGHKFSSKDIRASVASASLASRYLEAILLPILQQNPPAVAGISVSFPDQVFSAFACAQMIKTRFPNIHITMGGAFVTCHIRELTNPELFAMVDSFVLDDGEFPLKMLLQELSAPTPNFANVPGLIYRSPTGQIIKNAPAPSLDLNVLPAPDYSIFPLERYVIKKTSMALLFRLSHGCRWAKCAFCRTELPLMQAYSEASAGHLCAQLQTVIAQTGVTIFYFTDDAAPPDVLEDLCRRLLAADLKITWMANFRFDKRLTRERLQIYRQAGCRRVYLGLESYTDRVLTSMRKGFTSECVEPILVNLSEAGILTTVYMIVGFPGETEEEARESFRRIVRLKQRGLINRVIYNMFELQAYSLINAHPEKFGITHIARHPGADLMPPTTDFESTGMTRAQAAALCAEFIRVLRGI